jgi:membrane protein YdbS with pleckstrin-like domain
MYCDKCGADNADTAKFCRKCGLPIEEVEEKTRVRQRTAAPPEPLSVGTSGYVPPAPLERSAAAATDAVGRGEAGDEHEIFSIRPTLKFVKVGYVIAALGAVLLVAITSAYFYNLVSISLSVLIGLLLFLVPAYYHLRQMLVRYRMTDTALEIDTGLIARSTRNVPLRRIQDVTVSSTAMQRLLSYGNIEIDNASEEGGKVVLRDIDSPRRYADMLLKQMGLLDR